ncbi:MAG: DUF3786 domain-containing protein [Thermodesulfobacteriota bacterium]
MATGACGIDCSCCALHISGACGTCGPGNSDLGAQKLAVQRKLLGAGCPILECAALNRIPCCLADCAQFPCENFGKGPYPYSEGFLSMQKRRREMAAKAPGSKMSVPDEHWEELAKKDLFLLCADAVAEPWKERDGAGVSGLSLSMFGQKVVVDMENRTVLRARQGGLAPVTSPLFILCLLVYLLNVTPRVPTGKLVSVQDLKEAHFFTGPHALPLDRIAGRFGKDPAAFKRNAAKLCGEPLPMADQAFTFQPFVKIPVAVLLWTADEEFPARSLILFDETISRQLPADAIWALSMLTTEKLCADE